MAIDEDQSSIFSRLVLSLNASILEGEPWHDFLLLLRDHLNAKHATLILTPPHDPGRGIMITPTAPPAQVRRYLERFLAIDPFVGLPEGQVVALFEFVGEERLKGSEYYRDWFADIDGSHVLGVDVASASGFEARLRVTRAPGGGPFDQDERAHLKSLVPHLRQSIEIYRGLATSRGEEALIAGTVEEFAVGTVWLDHSLNVLRVNPIAATILAEADGIALVGKRLAMSQVTAEKRFRSWLEAALNPGSDGRLFPAARLSGRRDLCIVARRIDVPKFMHTGTTPALALLLGDPERPHRIDGQALRELFALTPTEALITASVANGSSVSEVALELAITENTVRAHLRSIFSKTGVSRQPQLVHLVHTSLPLNSPDAVSSD
ncbi:LuxR family transcriptional regulator [Sphingomonas paeninsulae]|uniref:LuxR family transcriptional regulator n=1 Tax=Sphingomonas paeninsulae TaxID=2319844 RepID=A0A494TK00_SPHPE|nr:helix-turn-helix transcriptional regulator [Sphingomonas paeninsulae]AYJ87732.1 LuxR family transcriptional regulator [Sphingomonas paeninsulae]